MLLYLISDGMSFANWQAGVCAFSQYRIDRKSGAFWGCPHTEGYYTETGSDYQHAQGKYNVVDSDGIYAHIVGNGSSSARSNAHTLDWEGNGWFAGNVYVGSTSGTNRDDGSKKLATEEYVDSKSPTRVTVTLTAAGWDATAMTQTVAVAGVLADEAAQLIQPMPAMASLTAYNEAGILCTGQAADALIFTASEVPTADITVYVVITEVGA